MRHKLFVVPMEQVPYLLSSFFISRVVAGCRDVVGFSTSSTLMAEQLVTAPLNLFAGCSCLQTCHPTFTGIMRNAFTEMCHLWFASDKRRVCAVCIWLTPQRCQRCGFLCCVRDSSARGLCLAMLSVRTSTDKPCAANVGTVHHGGSPLRPCPPCKLRCSHFS